MNIRVLATTMLVAALGAVSSQAFGQDKTIAPADFEKTAMASLQVRFFMGTAEMDRDSTQYKKMGRLQTACKAEVSKDILAAAPVASTDAPNAIVAVKRLFANCIDKGVAADPSLARVQANVQYVSPR
jgi:hypothetical protein